MRFLTTTTALLFSGLMLASCTGFDDRTTGAIGTAPPPQAAETVEDDDAVRY
ncbi:hypothetical protein [Caenispirillum salinarum]|uniref:hypothetical protein n=1 Tax=Caenispirillum salinarum TaxID=859058 RepID=UPI00384A9FF5